MLLHAKRTLGTIAFMGGVPAVLTEFTRAWGRLIQYNCEHLCDAKTTIWHTDAGVSDHAFARNVLAAQMQGDWLLMLDTDHMPGPDLAARMLNVFEQNDLDVLSGLYLLKAPPYAPVWYMQNAEGALSWMGDWQAPEGGGLYLVPLAAAGGGCLLVRRRVFQRIEAELHEQPFTHRGAMSEDHSFASRCRDLQIPIYGCPAIESPHLSVRSIVRAEHRPDPDTLSSLTAVAAPARG